MKRIFILILSLLYCVLGLPQGKDQNLDELLLKGFSSKDSAHYYFNKASKLLYSRADSASYDYFKFQQKYRANENDSAFYFSEKTIPIYIDFDSLNRLRKIYLGQHYMRLYEGKYEDAMNNIQKALTVAEKLKDTAYISLHLTDKANVYHDFENYDLGVQWGKKAFQMINSLKVKNYKYMIFANNVIAINFDDWNKPDSALFYHYKNLEYLKKVGSDTLRYSFVFNNIGNTLLKNKRYKEAKKYIHQSLTYNKLRGRNYNLATNYTNLATIAYREWDNQLAKQYFIDAYKFAEASQSIEKIRDVTQQEAWFYKKTGNYKKALERQEAFYLLKDSIFNKDRAKSVAEMATKYETKKKENKILIQKSLLVEKELEVKEKNSWIFGAFGLALILGLFGYLVYGQQKLKQEQLKKESELDKAFSAIEAQNKLQEQRLRISRDLHDNIGSQLTYIISSLDNLKYVQTDENSVDKLSEISRFTNNTINELRDTIWVMNKDDISWEDLQARISNFIAQAKVVSKKTSFNFNIDSSINLQAVFSSEVGMNVYRIIQESVNNATKYADASEITVRIEQVNSEYQVQIKDNGKGFDKDSITYGSGLINIQKRANDLGAKAEILSEMQKGTTISFSLPV